MTRPPDESGPADAQPVTSGMVNTPPPVGTDRVPPGPGGVPSLPADSSGYGRAGFGAPGYGPAATPTVPVATYPDYPSAQRAVDYLSDNKFPVEQLMIVGTDLKRIERITGRLTTGRVAVGGLLSGIWLGLFVGIIFALFDTGTSAVGVVLSTMLFGALFGLVWALAGYAATRGHRDFSSVTSVVATKYEVLVEHKSAQQARELLAKLPGALPNPFA